MSFWMQEIFDGFTTPNVV